MIKVLLADDQELLRSGFRMILSGEPDFAVIGEAANGADAVTAAATLHPDVVLMDIRMPGVDGIEATKRIVDSGTATRVPVSYTHLRIPIATSRRRLIGRIRSTAHACGCS